MSLSLSSQLFSPHFFLCPTYTFTSSEALHLFPYYVLVHDQGCMVSSQRHWESNDNNCKEREERRDREWEKLETSKHIMKYIYFALFVYLYCSFYTLFCPSHISSNLSLHQFSSFHCHFLNAPTSFSLFVCLSINPRAVGVVELVFPPSDKGFYRMSLTLKGS